MRYLFIFFIIFFLASCAQENKSGIASVVSTGDDTKSTNTINRSEESPTLKKAKSLYDTGEICKKSYQCRKLCEKLFTSSVDQKGCRELPSSLIDRFEFIHRAYTSKDIGFIQSVNAFDLQTFIAFSPTTVLQVFGGMGISLIKGILAWIAYDWETAEAFYTEDLDHSLLEFLLSQTKSIPIKTLGKAIKNGRTFHEIAILRQNDFALSWLHEFFDNKCEGENFKNKCVLDYYCEIYPSLQKDTSIEINEFEKLKSILNEHTKDKNIKLENLCLKK